jgi:hypothetical protein
MPPVAQTGDRAIPLFYVCDNDDQTNGVPAYAKLPAAHHRRWSEATHGIAHKALKTLNVTTYLQGQHRTTMPQSMMVSKICPTNLHGAQHTSVTQPMT